MQSSNPNQARPKPSAAQPRPNADLIEAEEETKENLVQEEN